MNVLAGDFGVEDLDLIPTEEVVKAVKAQLPDD